jgi:hypothetical protein
MAYGSAARPQNSPGVIDLAAVTAAPAALADQVELPNGEFAAQAPQVLGFTTRGAARGTRQRSEGDCS